MNEFFLHGGGTLSNLEDLAKALPGMDDAVFSFHANKEKNDFSNWVRDCLGKKILAREIQKMNKQDMAHKLAEQVHKDAAKKKKSA